MNHPPQSQTLPPHPPKIHLPTSKPTSTPTLTPLPISSQNLPKTSNHRWKILSLVCLSAFAYSFANTFMSSINIDHHQTRNQTQFRGFASIFPIICGIIISRLGTNQVYQFLAVISAVPAIMTVVGLVKEDRELYQIGESLSYAGSLGLFVAQISMIIKCFKGKEVSLALGALYASNSVAKNLPFQHNSLDKLYVPAISWLIAICGVIFLTQLDKKAQVENREQRSSLRADFKAIKLRTVILMAVIIIYSFADYFSLIIFSLFGANRWRESNEFFLISLQRILILLAFLSVFPFLLFGYLADKTNKRTAMMFLSFFLLLIGNGMILLFESIEDFKLITLALVLRGITECLFQVSAWACLGLSTEKGSFEIVLGITYAVVSVKLPWSMQRIYVGACILGMILMRESCYLKKKNERENGDQLGTNNEEIEVLTNVNPPLNNEC